MALDDDCPSVRERVRLLGDPAFHPGPGRQGRAGRPSNGILRVGLYAVYDPLGIPEVRCPHGFTIATFPHGRQGRTDAHTLALTLNSHGTVRDCPGHE